MSVPGTVSASQDDSANNGTSSNSTGGTPSVTFDLSTFRSRPASLPRYNQQRQPLYKSVTTSQKRFIKVKNVHLESPEEGQELAEHVTKNVKMRLEQGPRTEDKLTLVKTIVINGCILFIVDVTPYDSGNIKEDVLEMVTCLPLHLQQEEMLISYSRFSAIVKNGSIMEIHTNDDTTIQYDYDSCSMDHNLDTNRSSMNTHQQNSMSMTPREVNFIDPPCISRGNNYQLTIHTKQASTNLANDPSMRVVTVLGSKVVNEFTTDLHTHSTNVYVSQEDRDHCGSIRIIQSDFQNRPVVCARAPFLVLPKKQALEINELFRRKVETVHMEKEGFPSTTLSSTSSNLNSIEIRSYVWLGMLKPLMLDMDFILSQNSKELQAKIMRSTEARDDYLSVVENTLSFFKEEKMVACLSYFKRQLSRLCFVMDMGHPLRDVKLISRLNADYLYFLQDSFHGSQKSTKSFEHNTIARLLSPTLFLQGCSSHSSTSELTKKQVVA